MITPARMICRKLTVGVLTCCLLPTLTDVASLAAQETATDGQEYLYQGKLAEGEVSLSGRLKEDPDNDQVRFSLGLIQFGRALENLLQDLNRHGFLTRRTFGDLLQPELRKLFPDHEAPKVFSNAVLREMLENWVSDITRAEATLASIKDPDLKFHLKPARIRLQPVENGESVSAAELLNILFRPSDRESIREFGLTLDRGDVHWLRGYLHLQAAVGEFLLAHDLSEIVESGGHRVFEKVETPHQWLLSENRDFTDNRSFDDFIVVALDAVAVASLALDIPVDEPMRMKTVLEHLESTIDNGQKMWEFILAETDDDHEWIPNPRQTGAIGVNVRQEMIDTWLETLAEAKRIAAGEKLVPFWRDYLTSGRPGERGINLRKVFEHPPERMRIVLWVQGTAATPYLEQGEMTQFADEEFLDRIGEVFGSNFFGFAAWFN